jgi:hypothetical protein
MVVHVARSSRGAEVGAARMVVGRRVRARVRMVSKYMIVVVMVVVVLGLELKCTGFVFDGIRSDQM